MNKINLAPGMIIEMENGEKFNIIDAGKNKLVAVGSIDNVCWTEIDFLDYDKIIRVRKWLTSTFCIDLSILDEFSTTTIWKK